MLSIALSEAEEILAVRAIELLLQDARRRYQERANHPRVRDGALHLPEFEDGVTVAAMGFYLTTFSPVDTVDDDDARGLWRKIIDAFVMARATGSGPLIAFARSAVETD